LSSKQEELIAILVDERGEKFDILLDEYGEALAGERKCRDMRSELACELGKNKKETPKAKKPEKAEEEIPGSVEISKVSKEIPPNIVEFLEDEKLQTYESVVAARAAGGAENGGKKLEESASASKKEREPDAPLKECYKVYAEEKQWLQRGAELKDQMMDLNEEIPDAIRNLLDDYQRQIYDAMLKEGDDPAVPEIKQAPPSQKKRISKKKAAAKPQAGEPH
jgi:hypothetical protein